MHGVSKIFVNTAKQAAQVHRVHTLDTYVRKGSMRGAHVSLKDLSVLLCRLETAMRAASCGTRVDSVDDETVPIRSRRLACAGSAPAEIRGATYFSDGRVRQARSM